MGRKPPLMAFKNSVKATLFSETGGESQPPSAERMRAEELRAMVTALGNISLDQPAQPIVTEEKSLKAAWHARAEEIRAMTDTLSSEPTRPLMTKIAAIYDEFAREAGWSDPKASRVEDLGPEEAPQTAATQEAIPHAFPRRPVPLRRDRATRR